MKKSEIKALIKEVLEKNKNNLQVKGTYLGQKGVFFDFKKDSLGRTVAKFRTDDITAGGLKRSTWGIYIDTDKDADIDIEIDKDIDIDVDIDIDIDIDMDIDIQVHFQTYTHAHM